MIIIDQQEIIYKNVDFHVFVKISTPPRTLFSSLEYIILHTSEMVDGSTCVHPAIHIYAMFGV